MMKANEFIQKHGWDAVIEAMKTTPLDHDFQSTDLEPKLAKDGSIIGFDCKVYTISHAEVKRLVESHELVQPYMDRESGQWFFIADYCKKNRISPFDSGNYEKAKKIYLQAIADVESCQ